MKGNMHIKVTIDVSSRTCLLFAFLLIACEKPRPAYIEAIPDINEYSYLTTHDWNGVVNDTLVAETWYDSSKNEALIHRMGSILDIGNGKVWMSDWMRGSIFEFDEQGSFVRKVFSAGRGPSEFVRPVSMSMDQKSGSSDVYILDEGQHLVAKVTSDGVEKRRYFFKVMPFSFNGNKLTVLSDNEFMWPTFNQENALSSRDTLDQIVTNKVKPVIPIGYSPLVHNNLLYEITDKAFLYAYQGVPLIFVTIEDQKFAINLEPDKDLEEVGTPLTLLPATDTSVSVSGLIRGVMLHEDHIWVVYKLDLYRIPLDRKKPITVNAFVNENGEKVAFHPVYFTGQSLYMANNQTGMVYRMRL